ncbi:hypothetical protein [Jiangella muralis]|uniref:hypothetical protein n=1 Tax=Jiangella muralis TaxID=702383 RepID=UPI00069E02A5|nr:hypothetical protein [Jiangella muralis]
MTAQREPLRLYPTRRHPTPANPSPEWTAAKAAERERGDLIGRTRAALMRLVKVIDEVADLDRDGYLEVAAERVDQQHERAAELLFELGTELAGVLNRSGSRATDTGKASEWFAWLERQPFYRDGDGEWDASDVSAALAFAGAVIP